MNNGLGWKYKRFIFLFLDIWAVQRLVFSVPTARALHLAWEAKQVGFLP